LAGKRSDDTVLERGLDLGQERRVSERDREKETSARTGKKVA
jgi:hypothetical protein